MKKLLFILFVFSFLFIGSQVNANDEGCPSGQIYSSTTGAKCPVVPPICPPNMPSPKLCSDGSFSKIEAATKNEKGCTTSFNFICPETDSGCSDNKAYSSATGKVCNEFVAKDDGCKGSIYSLTTGAKCPASTLTTEAGCLNNEIYSLTTGQACPVDNGCNGANFSTETGKACPSVTIIDKGCNGTKYSLTTGQMCPISTITTYEGCNVTNKYNFVTGQTCPVIETDILTVNNDIGCSNNEVYSSTTGAKCSVITDNGCNGSRYSTTTGKLCGVCSGVGCYSPKLSNDSSRLNSVDMTSQDNTTPINRTLRWGMKGDDIKTLQAFLNLLADGSFGYKTKAKVIEWQKANGLTPDGAFGNMSRQKANLAQ